MRFFRRGMMHQRRGFLGRILDFYATTFSRRAAIPSERPSPVIALARASEPAAEPADDTQTIDLDRMMWMLDEVLEQSNLRASHASIEPVDIGAVLAAIVAECDEARVCVERAAWPVHVLAKAPEIKQLFATLVARALADSTRTIIRLDRGTNAMVAHFDDNGPGVPRSARDDLFVFSADRHPAENALATAWQMASALGGDIRVSSSPEGGARFTVRLPTICESEIAFAAAS